MRSCAPRPAAHGRRSRTRLLRARASADPTAAPPPAAPPAAPPPGDATPPGRALALGAAALGVALFVLSRSAGGPSLAALAASATPLDAALRSGRPTVVEFYADCAPRVAAAVRASSPGLNFVMLNVDNTAWRAEVDAYGVDGVPHFVFLDAAGAAQGTLVGKLPEAVLEADLTALRRGAPLPYARAAFAASALDSGRRDAAAAAAAAAAQPLAHAS